MLQEIANFQILGRPLVMYGGILTLLSFMFTASISMMNKRGIKFIPFKWHSRMAKLSLFFALVHGALGLSNYF